MTLAVLRSTPYYLHYLHTPAGFLGHSYYVSSLNARVQRAFDDGACHAHIREHLRRDSSKRPQPKKILDLPQKILSNYVFVPTQKFDDVSVQAYSRITFPQLLHNATSFCRERGLPLVIKIHPHLMGSSRATQEALISQLRVSHRLVFTSRASINFLSTHALFTMTLNGGSLIDSFYTQTPVLSLAHGFFQQTDALVSDDDAMRGMRRMVERELPWAEARKLRQRQIVCWYDRMALKVGNSARQNVAVLQAHIDALELPRRPIVL